MSSSTGSDNNDGLSESTPVKTIQKGISLLRNGYPDWLLLKKGDTWHEDLNGWKLSGRSASEPMVIWSYGTGAARPVLDTGSRAGITTIGTSGSPPSIDHVAFAGLRFYADTRDPGGPDWTGTNGNDGILWLLGTTDVLIEDCVFQSYLNGIVFQRMGSPISNVRLRFVQVLDSYSTSGHSEGMYTQGVDSFLMEFSLFDHNGWSEDPKVLPGAAPTVFNHNAYFHEEPGQITVRYNIIMRASSHGIQLRPGGTAQGNLLVRNPIGLLIGGGDNPIPGATGVLQDNVVLDGTDIDSSNKRGWGFDISNNTSGVQVLNNIIAHDMSASSGGPAVSGHGTSTTYTGNIVYDWNGAPFTSPTGPFVDSQRSVETYDASQGGPGTFADFAAQVRAQSRDHWQPAYAAQAINAYIRAGFAAQ